MLQMEAIAHKTSAQFIVSLKLQFYHHLQDNPVKKYVLRMHKYVVYKVKRN